MNEIVGIPETADVLGRYWQILYEPDDIVEVRRLLRKGKETVPKGSTHHKAQDLPGLAMSLLKDNRTLDIYVGLNPRTRSRGDETAADSNEDVALARCLCADVDDLPPGTDVREGIVKRLTDAGLPEPSLVLFSGHGGWAFWSLTDPMLDLAKWTAMQKRLIYVMGADKSIHDPPRITRLPGFLNHKKPKGRARIISTARVRHKLTEFDEILPSTEAVEAARAKGASTVTAKADVSTNGKIPYGKQHNTLLAMAGAMRHHGAEEATIYAALVTANKTQCEKPGPDANMAKMAKSIAKKEPGKPLADDAELEIIDMADVTEKPVDWFWTNRIPRGMLTLVVGDGGVGKSFLTHYLTSLVTQGHPLPDDPRSRKPGRVILVGMEDSPEYTIKARLRNCDCDMSKGMVQVVQQKVKTDDDGKEIPVAISIALDIGKFARLIENTPDMEMIVFDPVSDVMGGADENKNAEVRSALGHLVPLAVKNNIAVIVVTHMNKKSELKALYRALGSVAFTAFCRSVLQVTFDPTDDETDLAKKARLLSIAKTNNATSNVTLRFRIDAGKLVFDAEPVDMDADAAGSAGHARSDGGEKLKAAKAFLKRTLKSQRLPSADVKVQAKEDGISARTLARAVKDLDIATINEGFPRITYWSLDSAPEVEEGEKTEEIPI